MPPTGRAAAAGCCLALVLAAPLAAERQGGSCKAALEGYFGCSAHSQLFSLCSAPELLNVTAVQVALGCSVHGSHAASLGQCQRRCASILGTISNSTVDFSKPCPMPIQLMNAFSGTVARATTAVVNEALNMTVAMPLPVPNIVGPTGLELSSMGNPAKCVAVKGAQYCVLAGSVQALPGLNSTVFLGLCLPDTCTDRELNTIVQKVLPPELRGMEADCGRIKPLYAPPAQSFLQGTVQVDKLEAGLVDPFQGSFNLGPVYFPSAYHWTWKSVLALIVCLIPVVLVVIGTVVEVVQIRKVRGQVHPENAVLLQPLASTEATPSFLRVHRTLTYEFSLVKNIHQFLEVRPAAKNTFNCLDGFRVMSMAWVVLGHVFFWVTASVGLKNMEQLEPPNGLIGFWWFQLVPGGFYAVDTFLWLSGFLCANSLNKRVFNRPAARTCKGFGKLYPLFMIARYVRLLPLELFCRLFCSNILFFLGTGIIWNLGDGACLSSVTSPACKSDWWANALFIQNFYPHWPDQVTRCFGHTWYLAVDMQLYLITPFISLAYGFGKAVGWSVWALFMLGTIACNIFIIWYDKIIPSPIWGLEGFMGRYYAAPWIRAEPFLVGVAFAWLWTGHLSGRRPSLAQASVLTLAVAFLFFCCVFWGQHSIHHCALADCTSFDKQPMGKFGLVAWGSCNRLAWGVLLSLLSYLSFHRRFVPCLQEFLTLDIWQPLAKLCYGSYLIHPMWLVLIYCQMDDIETYTTPTMMFRYFSVLFLAFLTALCLYLSVEQPLGNLAGRLLGGLGSA